MLGLCVLNPIHTSDQWPKETFKLEGSISGRCWLSPHPHRPLLFQDSEDQLLEGSDPLGAL